MPRYTWKTIDSGAIEVAGLPDRPEAHLPQLIQLKAARPVLRWMKEAEAACAPHNLPLFWVLGMIYTESGGNENARAPDGGLGLLQITHPSLRKGLTDQQVLEPGRNLRIGCELIARHARSTQDLPTLASLFNAGAAGPGKAHPSEASPWGMRETPGHIERVVRASNTFLGMIEAGVCR